MKQIPTLTLALAGAVAVCAQTNVNNPGIIPNSTSTQIGQIRFVAPDGGNAITISAPSSIPASYTLQLPAADGSANQVLLTDGKGNLSFASPTLIGDAYQNLKGGAGAGDKMNPDPPGPSSQYWGWNNVIEGFNAAANSTKFAKSVIIGPYAGENGGTRTDRSGNYPYHNVLIGWHAGENSQTNDVVCVGPLSCQQNTTMYQSTCIGAEACMQVTTAPYITAVGNNALSGYAPGVPPCPSRYGSTCTGWPGTTITGTGEVVAIGSGAGIDCSTCTRSIYIGSDSGCHMNVMAPCTDPPFPLTGASNVIIGNNAAAGAVNSYVVALGNLAYSKADYCLALGYNSECDTARTAVIGPKPGDPGVIQLSLGDTAPSLDSSQIRLFVHDPRTAAQGGGTSNITVEAGAAQSGNVLIVQDAFGSAQFSVDKSGNVSQTGNVDFYQPGGTRIVQTTNDPIVFATNNANRGEVCANGTWALGTTTCTGGYSVNAGGTINAGGYAASGSAGITGTLALGTCSVTFTGGIVTAKSGTC